MYAAVAAVAAQSGPSYYGAERHRSAMSKKHVNARARQQGGKAQANGAGHKYGRVSHKVQAARQNQSTDARVKHQQLATERAFFESLLERGSHQDDQSDLGFDSDGDEGVTVLWTRPVPVQKNPLNQSGLQTLKGPNGLANAGNQPRFSTQYSSAAPAELEPRESGHGVDLSPQLLQGSRGSLAKHLFNSDFNMKAAVEALKAQSSQGSLADNSEHSSSIHLAVALAIGKLKSKIRGIVSQSDGAPTDAHSPLAHHPVYASRDGARHSEKVAPEIPQRQASVINVGRVLSREEQASRMRPTMKNMVKMRQLFNEMLFDRENNIVDIRRRFHPNVLAKLVTGQSLRVSQHTLVPVKLLLLLAEEFRLTEYENNRDGTSLNAYSSPKVEALVEWLATQTTTDAERLAAAFLVLKLYDLRAMLGKPLRASDIGPLQRALKHLLNEAESVKTFSRMAYVEDVMRQSNAMC